MFLNPKKLFLFIYPNIPYVLISSYNKILYIIINFIIYYILYIIKYIYIDLTISLRGIL